MKRRNDYMLIAVAAFIIIAIIVYLFSLVLGFEFVEINKIIVAVSIASYFLSFSEMAECNLDLQFRKYEYAKEKYDKLLSEDREFFRDIEKTVSDVEKVYTANADEIPQDNFEILESLKDEISKAKHDMVDFVEREKKFYMNNAKTFDKICFGLKVLSFLSLICVLAFEIFFKIIETQNNILCLFAFWFVIYSMVIKNSNIHKLEEHKKIVNDYTAAMRKHIEKAKNIMEDINGKVKNEDKKSC